MFSEPKIMGSLNAIGYRLTPVQGSYNKFWFVRKVEDGTSMEFLNGPKYYKLVVESREISVECTGDYNAFSMKGQLIEWMKAQLPSPLANEAVA